MKVARLILIALLVGGMIGGALAQARRSLWQSIVSNPRVRIQSIPPPVTPVAQSGALIPDACLGELPSAAASDHVLKFAERLQSGDVALGRVRVSDPASKMYCALLGQYWEEWSMDIPQDQIPVQYRTAKTPTRYEYRSPIARCIPKEKVTWCEAKRPSADAETELMVLMALYNGNCGRGRCPFANRDDQTQADYYLIQRLGAQLMNERNLR